MEEEPQKKSLGYYGGRIGKYEVVGMDADRRWHLFLDGRDTGRSYKRLTDARRAIKNEETKEKARSEKGE
jgi:hypothetical protein